MVGKYKSNSYFYNDKRFLKVKQVSYIICNSTLASSELKVVVLL